MGDVGIKVNNVSKNFHLPHEKANTVKGVFTSLVKTRLFRHSSYETQHALNDISFDIQDGEFFGIVGRNGSGKSTLLKILAGIYQPTEGSVSVTGRLVSFIELGVGFNPELTGRENVFLNGALLGFSEKEVSNFYKEVVAFAELEQYMDKKLKNYSSGMQVRLAFSMAVRAEADILLIDEVLAVGDADFQRKCFEYFKTLKKQKKTVVFVSHDMSSVREYCDRAVLIEQHEIIKQGDPEKVAEEYLKLFNPASEEQPKNSTVKSQNRWGDEKVVYTQVKVKKESEYIKVKATAKANRELSKPIFGVLVKNSEGQPICGTNSKLLRVSNADMSKSDKREIEWKLPNIFSQGRYTIDVAISHSDNITQSDWWHDAAEFNIINDKTTPFIVSPPINLEINSKN